LNDRQSKRQKAGAESAAQAMKKQLRPNNKISTHFAKRDFVCKCGRCEGAIKISLGLIGGLELLRTLVANRINILRAYMCPDAAEKLGSLKRNYYTMGIAADIMVDNLTATEVFRLAAQIPEFKGIGLNLDENYVHLDTRKIAEPILWVETNHTTIPIDDRNRTLYLGDNPILLPVVDLFSGASDDQSTAVAPHD